MFLSELESRQLLNVLLLFHFLYPCRMYMRRCVPNNAACFHIFVSLFQLSAPVRKSGKMQHVFSSFPHFHRWLLSLTSSSSLYTLLSTNTSFSPEDLSKTANNYFDCLCTVEFVYYVFFLSAVISSFFILVHIYCHSFFFFFSSRHLIAAK